MRTIVIMIAFTLAGLVGMAQTNQPLPSGAVPFGATTYLSPSDSTIWLYKERGGVAIKVANWVDVDSALAWHVSSSKPTKPGYRFTVIPNMDSDNDVVGVTGLSYKNNTDEYVVSYYSYDKEAKLWFYHRNSENLLPYSPNGTIIPTPDREIDVTAYIDHIQGNVWDPDSACYWILGTKKGAVLNDTNRVLISVDDSGNLISSHSLTGKINAQMGQITRKGDLLLIKPNNNATVYFLNRHTKNIVRTETAHTNYEGITYDPNRDIVWIAGDEGTIAAYDFTSWKILAMFGYKTLPDGSTENVEGLLVDPVDDKLLIGFDGYLHGASNNGNAIFKFDFPRYVPMYQNSITLVSEAPFNQTRSVINIRNTNDLFGGNLLNITSRGHVGGRVYNTSSQLAGGYTIQHGEMSGESTTIRFADFNTSTGELVGDNTFAAKRNMGGFFMKAVDRSTNPNTQTRHFDFDFLSGNLVGLSSSVDSISAVPKAYVTNEYLAAKAGLLESDQSWTGTNTFKPSVSSPNPGSNSFQIGYASAGSGTGTYIRAFNTSGDTSYLIRGYAHTSGIQALFNEGAVEASAFKLSALNTAPASASATGTTGEIRITSTHIYVCIATNTWVRAALTTW